MKARCWAGSAKASGMRRSVSRQKLLGVGNAKQLPAELEEIYAQLLNAEFSEDTAQDLLYGVETRFSPNTSRSSLAPAGGVDKPRRRRRRTDSPENAGASAQARPATPEGLQAALLDELQRRFEVSPTLGRPDAEQRTVMFVGPPGSGKTTSLVKLALRYGLSARIPMQILSTDTLRLGGSEQLGAYAGIMGAGFHALHNMAALDQALQECRTKQLVFIDTPGYAPGDINEAAQLAAFLSRNSHIDVHLVVPATLRHSTLLRIHERFAILRPSKVLFTHLDDVISPGAILDFAIRTNLPISYLANGQQIPEDIEEASKSRLAASFSDHVRPSQQTAA